MALRNIKSKIIFNVSLIAFIGGLLTALATGITSYNHELSNEETTLILNSQKEAEKISVFLSSAHELTNILAQNREIAAWLENKAGAKNNERIFDILNESNLKGYYSEIDIINNDGIVSASTNPNANNLDQSNSPYFKKSIFGYDDTVALLNPVSNDIDYYFSQAIKNNNNQVIGVIAAKMKAKNINSLLETTTSNQTNLLVDENGIVIYSADNNKLRKSLAPLDDATLKKITEEKRFPGLKIESLGYNAISDAIKNNPTESQNIKLFVNNQNETVTVSPISNSPFVLLTENSSKFSQTIAMRFGVLLFLPNLLTTAVILLLIYLLITKLLGPLEGLKKTAEAIGLGNFNQKKQITSGDELEELEDVLIKTSHQLETAYSEMEEKVKQRTAEIEKKNLQAEKTNQAMLNIMEDIEKERDKVENLAKDLNKFKLALDNTSEQVIITDKDGTILYANKGTEKVTGYKIKEVIGKKSKELWRIVSDPKEEEKFWNNLTVNKKSFAGELKNRNKVSNEYISYTTITPILNENKEVEFLISLSHDITKEKEVDKAKTEFVSLASHQLRTPLSSINWYAEMLIAGDAGKLNDDQEGFVKEIYKGNQRMVDLVNSLLDVSRLELGTFQINPELINLADPAKSVINELKPGISAKKLKIDFQCEENLPEIKADQKLIRIIFQNLLSNAVKYTPDGGKIGVSLSKEEKYLLLKVSDTGYGIPSNQQDKTFTKLFRADNVKAKDTEGTGLGLYIIKQIVDNSGGQISFESEEDKGTTFFVRLPLTGMKKKEGTKALGE
jgi:PAS domain S-box-containing protein